MIIPIKSNVPQSMKAYLQVLNPVLKLKDKETQLRETGYKADGIDQYSAELDSDGNLIGQ